MICILFWVCVYLSLSFSLFLKMDLPCLCEKKCSTIYDAAAVLVFSTSDSFESTPAFVAASVAFLFSLACKNTDNEGERICDILITWLILSVRFIVVVYNTCWGRWEDSLQNSVIITLYQNSNYFMLIHTTNCCCCGGLWDLLVLW